MNFRPAPTAVAATALVLAGWGGLGPVPASRAAVSPTIPLLTVGSTFPEPTLDLKKSDYANLLANLSLETLLQFNPQGKLEPDLATSWSQTGPVAYVYNLRHGVKFWDGNDLTAADVVLLTQLHPVGRLPVCLWVPEREEHYGVRSLQSGRYASPSRRQLAVPAGGW